MFMVGSMLLACSLAQDAAPGKTPDGALLDELIRKTNELKAFVAVYRIRTPKQEGARSIRVSFRAPDEMKCEAPGGFLMCIREGVAEIRGPSSGGSSMVATVPFVEQSNDRFRRFTDVLHEEFTPVTVDLPAMPSYGAQVDLKITPDERTQKDKIEFKVQYISSRTAILGWLEMFKDWSGTQTEDSDHIVFRTPRGSELSLSKHTGFLDSIRKETREGASSMELETLDLDPKLDDHSFDVPDPPADASDTSAQASAGLQQTTTFALRSAFFAWISRHVSDGKIEWNAEARAHGRKALEALHSDGIAMESGPWITETKKWIEKTGSWFHDRYAGLAKTDEAARGELETKAQENRKRLFDGLQRLLKERASHLDIDAAVVPDATLRASLLEIEEASVQAAFEHSLQNPLLESFDAQFERAKSGG